MGAMGNPYLIAPFGSTAAMLFGFPELPFSQPRNVVGGHVISALVGVSVMKAATLAGLGLWLTAPLAISGAVMAMQATKTFHPAGAGTALLAVIGPKVVTDLGYAFVVTPVAAGATTLVLSAVLFNNLFAGRRYPSRWN